MPIYRAICEFCEKEEDFFRQILDRDNLPACRKCGGGMSRILTPVTVRADIAPYESPVTGKWIESRAQRDEELARTGKIIAEPGWKNDVLRNREAQKAKDFEPISKGIDEVVTHLNNVGKLENLNVT